MLRSAFTAIISTLIWASLPPTAGAAEPEIYYFGASGCGYCDDGLMFLKRLQFDDKRVRLNSFDIVANPSDAEVYIRVVAAIGFINPQVPLTIIGNHAIIGYQDDETTGNEIRLTLEQCRLKTCPDLVHGYLPSDNGMIVAKTRHDWIIERKFAKAAQFR